MGRIAARRCACLPVRRHQAPSPDEPIREGRHRERRQSRLQWPSRPVRVLHAMPISTTPERLRSHASPDSPQPSNASGALHGGRARRSGPSCSAESRRSSVSRNRSMRPRSTSTSRLGELLMGSSAEPFSRLVGPEVFADRRRHGGSRCLRRETEGWHARRGPRRRCSPRQFDSDTLYWASVESVLGLPFYIPRDGSTEHRERLGLRLQLARAAGPWWALDGLAIVSERPLTASVDADGRLHAEDGPALAFGDGFTIHAWHGVTVDREVIEAPETITIEAIDGEANAERRRVLVERFGFDRLVREGHGSVRHEDETGRLWERPMGRIDWRRQDEPLVVRRGPELDARIRRLAKDLLPAGAATNPDGPRGRRLDLRLEERTSTRPAASHEGVGPCPAA